MRLLLDTHIFLWFITDDSRLPEAYAEAIRDQSNAVHLSVTSVWEAAIKYQLGKLPLPGPPAQYLPRQRDAHGITSLPIDEGAMTPLSQLPIKHRDPFDRIILAQAIQHDMTIATVDSWMTAYDVPTLSTSSPNE